MHDHSTLQIETRYDDRYQLIRLIGRGGMGEVYEGRVRFPLGQERRCAIKVMREDIRLDVKDVESFAREALLGWELSAEHRNLVTVRDFGVARDGRLYLIMDYIVGPPLHEVVRELAKRPAVIRRIALDVASALGYLHDRDVVHRDVSLSNILLTEAGVVKLTDLGLARHGSGEYSGNFRGASAFASPEALLKGPLTPRSDLYSLGAVLCHLVADGPRDDRETSREPVDTGAVLPSMGDTPPDIQRVIRGLTAANPNDRLSVSELRAQFDGMEVASAEQVAALVADWLDETTDDTSSEDDQSPGRVPTVHSPLSRLEAAAVVYVQGQGLAHGDAPPRPRVRRVRSHDTGHAPPSPRERPAPPSPRKRPAPRWSPRRVALTAVVAAVACWFGYQALAPPTPDSPPVAVDAPAQPARDVVVVDRSASPPVSKDAAVTEVEDATEHASSATREPPICVIQTPPSPSPKQQPDREARSVSRFRLFQNAPGTRR